MNRCYNILRAIVLILPLTVYTGSMLHAQNTGTVSGIVKEAASGDVLV